MRVKVTLFLCLVTGQPRFALTSKIQAAKITKTVSMSTHMRPVLNQSESLPVRVSTRLLSVTGVDEPRQLATIVCAVRYSWCDPFLTWDPVDYGGIDVMFLGQDDIWTPDMYQLHSPDGRGVLKELPTHHMILPSGQVTFRSAGSFTTFCNLDMTYFPYDRQNCLFKFGVLDAMLKNVELVPDGVEVSQEFVDHSEWDIEDLHLAQAAYGRNDEQFSVVEVFVTLRRRPRFLEVSMIVPVSLVSFLSLPSFLVSVESGERLSYSLTVLLSLAVYVSSTSSIMPHSSLKLPLLLLYWLMLFLLSSLCVLVNVILTYIRRAGKVRVVQGSKVITLCGFHFRMRKNTRQNYNEEHLPHMYTDLKKISKDNSQSQPLASKEVYTTEGEMHSHLSFKEDRNASGDAIENYENLREKKNKAVAGKEKEDGDHSDQDPDLEELGLKLDNFLVHVLQVLNVATISSTDNT
ncbi:neuronal acetylcholine receptor subunit beta-3-like [Aplysia californica]|uniref:Neuronal acetylcholine receptor subunit beta-3-like n=1 Tax=Aplysia californica TaxID=6500 RepID=A0ABM0JIX3_APLCA|nr:neuronal acetylcholine receptor subunit beta-3-like [Aplysia californica]